MTRTDEARAAAVARYGPMAPLAEIQRAAFVAGWEAGLVDYESLLQDEIVEVNGSYDRLVVQLARANAEITRLSASPQPTEEGAAQ